MHKLFTEKRIHREKIGNRWLYCSGDMYHRQKQLDNHIDEKGDPKTDFFPDELKAAIVLFFSLLDEKTRRLYAGLESLKWGHGGDHRISSLLGIDEKTVARGRRELLEDYMDHSRIRKPGGGRKTLKKGLQK